MRTGSDREGIALMGLHVGQLPNRLGQGGSVISDDFEGQRRQDPSPPPRGRSELEANVLLVRAETKAGE